MSTPYDIDCNCCPRLAAHLDELRPLWPDYWCRPVAAIGPVDAPLLVVGLAPGMHGANRTGRPFSGDQSGLLLTEALQATGFSWPGFDEAGLASACRITNAVKCLPPLNRPILSEVRNCNPYLQAELASVPDGGVVLALGRVAHGAVLLALGRSLADWPFVHGACGRLGRHWLLSSYHCSRYNIQTKRLTVEAFHGVVMQAADLLRNPPKS
ncbi:MAG: uracil-DNA glycosylase [Gammaproteobacteria bacterium]|nr:uracil-DNA glycosylase [Gammaproteobacteria bacterium]